MRSDHRTFQDPAIMPGLFYCFYLLFMDTIYPKSILIRIGEIVQYFSGDILILAGDFNRLPRVDLRANGLRRIASMINTLIETPMSLARAAATLTHRKRPVSPSTLWRWANSGIRGVFLETIRIGGCTCTTKESLQRFYEATGESSPLRKKRRTPKQRERAAQAAGKRLAARGV